MKFLQAISMNLFMEHQGNDVHPNCKEFITNEKGFDKVGLKWHITFVFQQICFKRNFDVLFQQWITIYEHLKI